MYVTIIKLNEKLIKMSENSQLRKDIDNVKDNVITATIDKYSQTENPIILTNKTSVVMNDDWKVIDNENNYIISKKVADKEQFIIYYNLVKQLEHKMITGVVVKFIARNCEITSVAISNDTVTHYVNKDTIGLVDNDKDYEPQSEAEWEDGVHLEHMLKVKADQYTVGDDQYLWEFSKEDLKTLFYQKGAKLIFNVKQTNQTAEAIVINPELQIYFDNELQSECDVLYNRLEMMPLDQLMLQRKDSQDIFLTSNTELNEDTLTTQINKDSDNIKFQSDKYIPENWTSSEPSLNDAKYCYKATRRYTSSWQPYSNVILYKVQSDSDVEQYEWIYTLKSNTGVYDCPESTGIAEGSAPTGWIIGYTPQVDKVTKYCYACFRIKTNGKWSDYGTTKQIADDGTVKVIGKAKLINVYDKIQYAYLLLTKPQNDKGEYVEPTTPTYPQTLSTIDDWYSYINEIAKKTDPTSEEIAILNSYQYNDDTGAVVSWKDTPMIASGKYVQYKIYRECIIKENSLTWSEWKGLAIYNEADVDTETLMTKNQILSQLNGYDSNKIDYNLIPSLEELMVNDYLGQTISVNAKNYVDYNNKSSICTLELNKFGRLVFVSVRGLKSMDLQTWKFYTGTSSTQNTTQEICRFDGIDERFKLQTVDIANKYRTSYNIRSYATLSSSNKALSVTIKTTDRDTFGKNTNQGARTTTFEGDTFYIIKGSEAVYFRPIEYFGHRVSAGFTSQAGHTQYHHLYGCPEYFETNLEENTVVYFEKEGRQYPTTVQKATDDNPLVLLDDDANPINFVGNYIIINTWGGNGNADQTSTKWNEKIVFKGNMDYQSYTLTLNAGSGYEYRYYPCKVILDVDLVNGKNKVTAYSSPDYNTKYLPLNGVTTAYIGTEINGTRNAKNNLNNLKNGVSNLNRIYIPQTFICNNVKWAQDIFVNRNTKGDKGYISANKATIDNVACYHMYL